MAEFSMDPWNHYREFVQAVRRYRPSDLLPFLARWSAEQDWTPRSDDRLYQRTPPWAVAAIARESVLRGNEHRGAVVDWVGLRKLFAKHYLSYDRSSNDSMASTLITLTYEQFPYRRSLFEELARSHALLVKPLPGAPIIKWEELLGIPLQSAVRAALALQAWVRKNGGRFDSSLLDLPHFAEVFELALPREDIEKTAEFLMTTPIEAKALAQQVDQRTPIAPHLAKYGFNPIVAKPLVDLGRHGVWSPLDPLIPMSVTGSNLYYAGIKHWGTSFSRLLGERTEAYVGVQLRLLPRGTVHPEIIYGDSQKSIDWFVVDDDVVVLVESKSARLPMQAQAGDRDALAKSVDRYIQEAKNQIERSAKLVSGRHPQFAEIPADRTIIGAVVTTEQFELINTDLFPSLAYSSVPTVVLSLRQLEALVCRHAGDAAQVLRTVAESRTTSDPIHLSQFLQYDDCERNPILEQSWHEYALLEEARLRERQTRSQR